MKNISKEEFESLSLKRMGRAGGSNLVTKRTIELEVGTGLIALKEEWIPKTSISNMLGQYSIRLNRKWKVRQLSDGSGWAVLRIS